MSAENPPDATSDIAKLAALLSSEKKQQSSYNQYISAKNILLKIAMGTTLAGSFLAPKLAYIATKSLLYKSDEHNKWKNYNQSYLRQNLKRMHSQKLIEVEESDEKQVIKITEKGRKRIYEYSLTKLTVPKVKSWDKKWRIIIYDIPVAQKKLEDQIRRSLINIGFIQIQKSIYVIPYPCYKEIEFLRSYYRLGQNLKYMLVTKLEDDTAYKEYFDIKDIK